MSVGMYGFLFEWSVIGCTILLPAHRTLKCLHHARSRASLCPEEIAYTERALMNCIVYWVYMWLVSLLEAFTSVALDFHWMYITLKIVAAFYLTDPNRLGALAVYSRYDVQIAAQEKVMDAALTQGKKLAVAAILPHLSLLGFGGFKFAMSLVSRIMYSSNNPSRIEELGEEEKEQERGTKAAPSPATLKERAERVAHELDEVEGGDNDDNSVTSRLRSRSSSGVVTPTAPRTAKPTHSGGAGGPGRTISKCVVCNKRASVLCMRCKTHCNVPDCAVHSK
eukprot:PhM_4_TR11041/c0_g2_i1/m.87620